jgi:hypothetical protein
MEKIVEQSLLYDFYGEMLNEHQRRIYEDAVFNDLSLGEIAAQEGISRQGVHDLLRRCNKSLEEYESKLHLMERYLHVKEKVSQIKQLAHGFSEQPDLETMAKIEMISNDILEEL